MFGVNVITIEPGIFRTAINDDQRMLDIMDNKWRKLPEEIREEYGEECFKSGLFFSV